MLPQGQVQNPYDTGRPPDVPEVDPQLINYKHVDWSSFPRFSSLKKQLKWCRKTLSADRLLWVLPYFYHNEPGVCIVDGTDCTNPLIYQYYSEEMKEILKSWPIMSNMDSGRAMVGTYCPECTKVLLTAIAIRRMLSTQRQKKTMNPLTRLYNKFQKKKHQFWGALKANVPDVMRREEKPAWEDVYAPFIQTAREDKLPVYMVDTNETIIIIKKDVLDEKYGKKEETADDEEGRVPEEDKVS